MPNFDENNVHSIEFEAPLSSDSSAAAKRHFSIDLSLELERQLDMESYPPTPVNHTIGVTKSHNANGAPQRESLDPHVLSHIVKQLQQALADVTKDRDELRNMIATAHSNEAELQDALQHMTDKATTMEIELSDARRKMKDDEDAINMLRTKVEESRRGLMRLQTENRRQSLAPVTALDLNRAGISSFGSPQSSKRASFTPLTGNPAARPPHGHRRISSVSDSGMSPNAQTLTFPDLASPYPPPPSSSRRYSGLFGRTSPSQLDPDPSSAEVDTLKKELQTLKDELERTKHHLIEANEAKEASETCVQALREFIGENSIGAREAMPLNLPPPPTMAKGDEDENTKAGSAVGWGFKLWKDTPRTSSIPQSATIPTHAIPTPLQTPLSATPLSRKIGGFFSSRGSVSTTSSTILSATMPPLQTNAARSIRDSVYSTSDTSSMAEPISPQNEINTSIIVRDATHPSDGTNMEANLEMGKVMQVIAT